MTVPARNNSFDHVLSNMLPIVWRRRRVLYMAVVIASCAAFLFYSTVGERYEVYTLLRVGQGIKEKAAGSNTPFGEGIDLASRIDSLARIGSTDYVISQAMEIVGVKRLFNETHMTMLDRARQAVEQHFGAPSKPSDAQISQAEAVAALRDRISARQEGRSDLLRISFRFPDPAVAADFLNALANSLVGIQAGLVQLPGADEFFQDQAKRLELEAEKAGAALKEFSVAQSIYSATEQRALLLKRASELSTLIASTRGSIEDKKGQKQAIIDQLLILRPVTQSKTVTGIVGRLGGSDYKAREATTAAPQFEEAPPLLLVKVYQDAMATLLKVNSELSGAVKLEATLDEELERVNEQLGDLTSREAEYDRLKRVLTRASSAADHYGVRMMEEQISQDSAKKTQLSSVRVVQLADKPIAPMLPRIGHLVVLALLGGIGSGAALALLLELAQLRRQQEEVDEFVAIKLGQLSGRSPVRAAE
jgi:uncharacterized protein involved in exopolysaccharide biosynthesis